MNSAESSAARHAAGGTGRKQKRKDGGSHDDLFVLVQVLG